MLKLEGRIDTITAPELLEIFDKALEKGKINNIVIDAKELNYISSSGLRVILKMIKTIGKNIEINNANELVKDIFNNSGFSKFIKMN